MDRSGKTSSTGSKTYSKGWTHEHFHYPLGCYRKGIAHPAEKIWRALTEGPLIKEWLMDNDFQPVVGHVFSFRATPVPNWDGVIDGEVLVIEPNKKLSYSWGTMGMSSVVTWTLAPTDSGTHVRMEHSGFGQDQEAAYKGASYGWQRFIGNLERVVGAMQ